MEIIPLIYVNNDNVLDSKGLRVRDWNKFMEHMNNVYVFDIGGMKRNKPSLELYQRIGEYAALWVDASPRRFEDVMDVVVAGAEKVTIRKPFFSDDVSKVFDAVEVEVYSGFDVEELVSNRLSDLHGEWTGVVVYVKNPLSLKERGFLRDLAAETPVFVVEKEKGFVDERRGEEIGLAGLVYPVELEG